MRKWHASAETNRHGLTGKVAVVTGGTKGLGFAIARHLGAAGATVVVGARNQTGVDDAVARLTAEGVMAYGLACDVGVYDDVVRLRDEALAHGGLDIWVNNAGASGPYGPTHLVSPESFARVVRTNILGTFHGSRAVLPGMIERGGGHLVNVYGRGDRKPVRLQNAYASSKTWVRSFTRTLQKELRGTGVRVQGFNPGLVMTEMLLDVAVAPGYEGKLTALPTVVGLWGQSPDDAARPILDLVTSDAPEYSDLTTARMMGRGVRSLATGRLRRDRLMPMTVNVAE